MIMIEVCLIWCCFHFLSLPAALPPSSRSPSCPFPPPCHQCQVSGVGCHLLTAGFLLVCVCPCVVLRARKCWCSPVPVVCVCVCVCVWSSLFFSLMFVCFDTLFLLNPLSPFFVCLSVSLSRLSVCLSFCVCACVSLSGSLTQSTSMSHVEAVGRTWTKKPIR